MRSQLLALLLFTATACAQPRFAGVFSDHVVLQRDRTVKIWGFGARVGQKIEVRLGADTVPAAVTRGDRWEARFSPRQANSTGVSLALYVDGKSKALVKDVVFGDVWLAAGQSNMQFPIRQIVKKLPEAKSWVAESDRSLVRMRRINDPVREIVNAMPDDVRPGQWLPMSPQSVVNFSAVAAVYARELHERLKVPIGIIDVSWGGKPIEPFIPRPAFYMPVLRQILELANKNALEELKSLPGGVIIRNPQGRPGVIYNARMYPLTSLRIKGFIWYQAESNCGRGEDPRFYRLKQQAMIEGWREAWKDALLPCYYVQLPSFAGATGWIRMREEQRLALSVPKTGMAVAIDVRGEGIHPPDKLSVGRRLAHIALTKTYGRGTPEAEGPTYTGHRIDGRTIRVQFKNAKTGLMIGNKPGVAPARETPGEALRWFEIADANERWHSAQAVIVGSEVILSSPGIKTPMAARYACSTKPQGGNLYNRAGFPASPFCTDLRLLPWVDHGAK